MELTADADNTLLGTARNVISNIHKNSRTFDV
jgi:hypothetical protein